MIRAAAGLLVRVLLELALLLGIVAAVLAFLAYRTSRRLVLTPNADALERYADVAGRALAALAAVRARQTDT